MYFAIPCLYRDNDTQDYREGLIVDFSDHPQYKNGTCAIIIDMETGVIGFTEMKGTNIIIKKEFRQNPFYPYEKPEPLTLMRKYDASASDFADEAVYGSSSSDNTDEK